MITQKQKFNKTNMDYGDQNLIDKKYNIFNKSLYKRDKTLTSLYKI